MEPYHVPGEVSGSQPDSFGGNVSERDRLRIDGYTFVFESGDSERFNGSTIGQVNYLSPNRIYIQSGLGVNRTYSTCVHEKLHLLRLEKDSEDMHDWIYEYEDLIPDSTCFELVRRRFGPEYVSDVRGFVRGSFGSKVRLEAGY